MDNLIFWVSLIVLYPKPKKTFPKLNVLPSSHNKVWSFPFSCLPLLALTLSPEDGIRSNYERIYLFFKNDNGTGFTKMTTKERTVTIGST